MDWILRYIKTTFTFFFIYSQIDFYYKKYDRNEQHYWEYILESRQGRQLYHELLDQWGTPRWLTADL